MFSLQQRAKFNPKRLIATLTISFSLALSGFVPAQANPIDVAGQSGDFEQSWVGVTGFSISGNNVTFTTDVAHNFFAGDRVSTSGFSATSINVSDSQVKAVPTTTSFTLEIVGASGSSGAGIVTKDTGRRFIYDEMSGDGTTVTVQADGHGLAVGDTFEIVGGTHLHYYGLKRVASVPNADIFTFSSSETQTRFGGTVRTNIIGSNLAHNAAVHFRNVMTVNGTNIHARVTFSNSSGIDARGTASRLESLQIPQADAANHKNLNTDIEFSVGTGRFAELVVLFYTGTPANAGTTTVELTNVTASVYDVDNDQFVRFSNVKSVEPLDANTILTASGSSGTVTFQSSSSNTSDASSFTRGRATVILNDGVTGFTYRIGLADSGEDGGASYALDLSSGVRVATFDANQGTGSMSSQISASAAALTTNSFTRAGFTFAGWNTQANGGGTSYANGATFPFSANTTLYAQWTAINSNVTVTFDSNGGVGTMASQTASSATNLSANTFTRLGQIFAGWNTQANGSGTTYADGASFPFTADTTLYAQWASPASFTGPIPMNPSTIPAETPTEATLTGERLNLITGATVNGKPVTLKPISATIKGLVFPALPAGTYDVIFTYQGGGTITQQAGLRVTPSSAVAAPQPGQFNAQRLFANYRGDRGPVIARDRAAITAFINQYKGITTVRCVGSTSGVPARTTDPALAQARAKNACDIVKRLVPNATISLETSTGKGIGQRFRSVTIFISGTN